MTALKIEKDQVKGFECVFGTYIESQHDNENDAIFVKEKVHLKDGSIVSHLRMYENYKRDFYITQEKFRNHEQKKEYEEIKRLKKHTTTQRKMPVAIARQLHRNPVNPRLSMLLRSPYVYGADITSTALLKYKYMSTFPDCRAALDVAVVDLETNVHTPGQEILSATLTMKNRVFMAVTKDFVGTDPRFEEKLEKCFDKHLSKYRDERKIQLEVVTVEHEGEAVVEVMKRAHKWKPDFVAAWNINFDLPKMLTALERHNIDAAQVMSDPSVPDRYKYAKYKEANKVKTMASGKTMILHNAELWHVMVAPSTFYWIDFMALYKLLRVTEGNQPKYSLDAILKVNNLDGKLRFDEADEYSGLAWHQFMQRMFKIEYLVYNIFDCISVELLEEKNNDTRAFSILCGHSDWAKFKSTPRRLCDDLHFFYLDRGKVAATTSDNMGEELDKYVVSIKDWINDCYVV